MKIRLFLLMLCLFALAPVHAQPAPHFALVHVMNPNAEPRLFRFGDTVMTIAPNLTVSFYIDVDVQVFMTDSPMPIDYRFEAGSQYLLVYQNPTPTNGFLAYQAIAIDAAGELVSDAEQSIWWIGNLFREEATLEVLVDGEVVISNLTPQSWNYFSAPLRNFDLHILADGETLLQTSAGFGEPYYTGILGFAGLPSPRLMTVMIASQVNTDLLTWLDALSALNIAPYSYAVMTSLIQQANAQDAFNTPDRVVLLPYDEAFANIRINTDPAVLGRLLANHLLIRSDVPASFDVPLVTLAKQALPVRLSGSRLTIGDANYITNVFLTNGVEVWQIDRVLLPTGR